MWGDVTSKISAVNSSTYLKNFKEVNGKSYEIWVWEVECWEATANLESATSAPLPHRGAVALLQQLRHHAVRENVAGPPAIKGHGIS